MKVLFNSIATQELSRAAKEMAVKAQSEEIKASAKAAASMVRSRQGSERRAASAKAAEAVIAAANSAPLPPPRVKLSAFLELLHRYRWATSLHGSHPLTIHSVLLE